MFRRSFSSRLALAVFALWLPSLADAQVVPVRLNRWAGPGALISNPGPGPNLFRLTAEAVWDPITPSGPGRYTVRVTLPNGCVYEHPVTYGEGPGTTRLTVFVPAAAVQNKLPAEVLMSAVVVDQATGAVLTPPLQADISQFPRPRSDRALAAAGPFGWGRPLEVSAGQAHPLPNRNPDGLVFVRVPSAQDQPGFYISADEATIQQVNNALPGYDPRVGRSDEFLGRLEGPDQPALDLTPSQADAFVDGLTRGDPSGVAYRLPTQEEWLLAARAGQTTPFWWGDEPSHPEGANFLGAEPNWPEDRTAPAPPARTAPDFQANPWGLYHTFGNVAEWAVAPDGGFVRLGGHFRTQPVSPLPDPPVAGPSETGPDAFVGVRPVFDLDSDAGTDLVRRALKDVPGVETFSIQFDPDRATAVVGGQMVEPGIRRLVDRRLKDLWFLAAVENQLITATVEPGRLALLGPVAGSAHRIVPSGRWIDEVPVSVVWAEPLPVKGSEWYVNVYSTKVGQGCHYADVLVEPEPGQRTVTVLLKRSQVPIGSPVMVALSLGAPAPTTGDPHIVSNLFAIGPMSLSQ